MWTLLNTPNATSPVTRGEVDEPSPEPDEAVIEVRAFSINRGELALLRKRDEGWRPGQDVAGVVSAAARDGSGPAVGTRVVGLAEQAGWSQRVPVPTTRLAALDDQVELAEAATLPIAGVTAWRTLHLGPALHGARVLVTGASGAVGRFQVELAAQKKAEVTAVAAEHHHDALHALGATETVTTPGDAATPFDLATESVGGDSLTQTVTRATPGATIVLLGNSSGHPTPISLYDFVGHEGTRLQTYFSYASQQHAGPDLRLLTDEIAADRLHPHIAHRTSIADIAPALDAMTHRRVHGKIIIETA